MAKDKVFILTQAVLNYRITKNSDTKCHVCHIECKVGDSVFTKQASGNTRKIRHEECARKVGIL